MLSSIRRLLTGCAPRASRNLSMPSVSPNQPLGRHYPQHAIMSPHSVPLPQSSKTTKLWILCISISQNDTRKQHSSSTTKWLRAVQLSIA